MSVGPTESTAEGTVAGSVAAEPWWQRAAGYEVYLRSFADGDGDGVGDLVGLLARIDHLAWLGIDLLWITPFYPSPMADHGYDIADHAGVDPRYGTLDDLRAVVDAAHERGIRVVIDLVPNHTSDQHRWFQAGLRDASDPHRGYYLWRDGREDGGPPNNWVSYFGGPAWSHDPSSGQWWAHLFLPEQPDLDWANPDVVREFDHILAGWLELGIDGFRIDVAQGLAKHPSLADNPPRLDPPPGDDPRAAFHAFEHLYDIGQPGSLELFARWRALARPFDAVLIGEVYLDAAAIGPYLAGDGLHLAFSFDFVALDWDAAAVRGALQATVAHLGTGACWTQTSHDEPRPPTRFGGGDRGRARALAVTTLLAGMPGPLVLFQGEELGLEDGAVPPDRIVDAMGGSRDGCRTPIPWAPEPGWGFTSGEPWLPFGDRRPEDTVEHQRALPTSWLHRHRALLAARRLLPAHAEARWLPHEHVVAYERGDAVVAAAIADADQELTLPTGAWRVAFSTHPERGATAVLRSSVMLSPAEAVILRRVATIEGGDG
jgi:alpha-glucosidase